MAKKVVEEVEKAAPAAPSREDVLLDYAKKLAAGRASEGDVHAVRRIGEALLAEEKAAKAQA